MIFFPFFLYLQLLPVILAQSYYVCEKNWRVLRLHSGPWGLMAVRSPFIFFAIALSSKLFQELHLNTSSHQIKVGYTGPSPFSQSLGTLVFGATPPPSSSSSDLIRLMLTLGCTGGFQRQHVHCTVPWWKLQVNTGCDTLLERPWDVCTPQWFLWRRKKEKKTMCVWVPICLCVWRRQQGTDWKKYT